MARPFRWDVARREQLGTLARGEPARSYPGFADDLRACCARVLATAGDATLAFVGRSPESLFDYLTGALADTSWRDRCVLVNLSLRDGAGVEVRSIDPAARAAVREQLGELRLDPASIAAAPRPVALVDLIYRGETLGNLLHFLTSWAAESGVDPEVVRRRLRVIGVTERTKNSPNTWRWRQRAEWAAAFRPSALKGVSISYHLWTYLGDTQQKVTRSNPPWRWGDERLLRPPREAEHLEALRLAVQVHERARSRAERLVLAGELARQPAMRYAWLRSLVLELRQGA